MQTPTAELPDTVTRLQAVYGPPSQAGFGSALFFVLDEWADDLADLRAKAAGASADVKDKLDLQIAELKVKWDEADARRRELLDAADDHWDDMKDAAQAQWTDLKAGVKDGIERVKSLFS